MLQRRVHLTLAGSVAALALVAACQPAAAPPAAEATAPAATNDVAADAATNATVADAGANATAPAVEPAGNATDAAAAAPAAGNATTAAAAAPAAGAMLLEVKDAAGTQLSGDPAAGERVFRQCSTCHVVTPGVNKVGPSLHAIIGRQAGTVPGFRYSEANKNSGLTWTEQQLYTYLENPRGVIPGTIMAFNGVKQSQQRADLIAYLKTATN